MAAEALRVDPEGFINKASKLTPAASLVEILHNNADANSTQIRIWMTQRWYCHIDNGAGIGATEFTNAQRVLFRSERSKDDRMGCFGEGQKLALTRLATGEDISTGGTSILISSAGNDHVGITLFTHAFLLDQSRVPTCVFKLKKQEWNLLEGDFGALIGVLTTEKFMKMLRDNNLSTVHPNIGPDDTIGNLATQLISLFKGKSGTAIFIHRPNGVKFQNNQIMVQSNEPRPVNLEDIIHKKFTQCKGITKRPAFMPCQGDNDTTACITVQQRPVKVREMTHILKDCKSFTVSVPFGDEPPQDIKVVWGLLPDLPVLDHDSREHWHESYPEQPDYQELQSLKVCRTSDNDKWNTFVHNEFLNEKFWGASRKSNTFGLRRILGGHGVAICIGISKSTINVNTCKTALNIENPIEAKFFEATKSEIRQFLRPKLKELHEAHPKTKQKPQVTSAEREARRIGATRDYAHDPSSCTGSRIRKATGWRDASNNSEGAAPDEVQPKQKKAKSSNKGATKTPRTAYPRAPQVDRPAEVTALAKLYAEADLLAQEVNDGRTTKPRTWKNRYERLMACVTDARPADL